MRRVLRQVITGLVSILLDAILQSSGGGGGGGRRRAGAREEGGGGVGRGGGACRERPGARAGEAVRVRVRERAPCGAVFEGAGQAATAHVEKAGRPGQPAQAHTPSPRAGQGGGEGMRELEGGVEGQANPFQAAIARKSPLCT